MPKRVLDGEAMWGSQRIGRLPDWMRPHYAWLYPLALSNGVFECMPRLVWAQCYAANMPHITVEDAAAIIRGFNGTGLLFLWEHSGKQWGYWTNSDKPGRLPGKARRGRNEKAGPEPPKEELRKYLESHGCHLHPGFGFGLGSGFGFGSGKHTTPDGGVCVPEREGESSKSNHSPDRQFAVRMFEFYNAHRGPLPLAMQLTKERQAKCEARIRSAHNDLAGFFRQWQAAVVKAANHPWPSWKPDFGYLIANDTNYLKVLEGKYDGWTDNAAAGGGISRQMAAVSQRQSATAEALRSATGFIRRGAAETQRALPPAHDSGAGGDVHGSVKRPHAKRN